MSAGECLHFLVIPAPGARSRATPPMEGNWLRAVAGQSSLSRRGAGYAGGVVYSIAQAWSNTYEPVLSLYVVFAGAYMMHDPPGLDARQLVAVPADV